MLIIPPEYSSLPLRNIPPTGPKLCEHRREPANPTRTPTPKLRSEHSPEPRRELYPELQRDPESISPRILTAVRLSASRLSY